MSWSAKWRVNKQDILKKLESSNVNTPEALEQLNHALDAASMVLTSDVLGGTDKSYIISLSGHANPGHEPVPGWSNDYVTITIYQEDK